MRPTVSQSIRTIRRIVLLSVRVASHATSCSKSRVNPLACRANGTPSTLTPCSGHSSRRSWARSSRRQTPRSKCRQTDSTCCRLWRCGVEKPHSGQQRRRRRSARWTVTRSSLKRTLRTQIPSRRSSRENPALTRIVVLLLSCLTFDSQQLAARERRRASPSATPRRQPHPCPVSPTSMPASDPLSQTPRSATSTGETATASTTHNQTTNALLQADSQQPANLHPCREPPKIRGCVELTGRQTRGKRQTITRQLDQQPPRTGIGTSLRNTTPLGRTNRGTRTPGRPTPTRLSFLYDSSLAPGSIGRIGAVRLQPQDTDSETLAGAASPLRPALHPDRRTSRA
jgi:hypothetical protein